MRHPQRVSLSSLSERSAEASIFFKDGFSHTQSLHTRQALAVAARARRLRRRMGISRVFFVPS